MALVLRTRQDRTERRLRHKKEANPPPMEPPPQLLNNNYLYIDLNMNFSENTKQQPTRTRKVGFFGIATAILVKIFRFSSVFVGISIRFLR